MAQGLPSVNELDLVIECVTEAYRTPVHNQLARISDSMSNVAARYGLSYLDLQPLAKSFIELERALMRRVADQEQRLFPSLRQLIRGDELNGDFRKAFRAAVEASKSSDERISGILRDVAELTQGYAPAQDAASIYCEMIHELASLDEQTRECLQAEARLLRLDDFEC